MKMTTRKTIELMLNEVALEEAKEEASAYGKCPQCQSGNIEYGAGKELSGAIKPWVSCGECGALLSWG